MRLLERGVKITEDITATQLLFINEKESKTFVTGVRVFWGHVYYVRLD